MWISMYYLPRKQLKTVADILTQKELRVAFEKGDLRVSDEARRLTLTLAYTDPDEPDLCMVVGSWLSGIFRRNAQIDLQETIESAVLSAGGIDFVDSETQDNVDCDTSG